MSVSMHGMRFGGVCSSPQRLGNRLTDHGGKRRCARRLAPLASMMCKSLLHFELSAGRWPTGDERKAEALTIPPQQIAFSCGESITISPAEKETCHLTDERAGLPARSVGKTGGECQINARKKKKRRIDETFSSTRKPTHTSSADRSLMYSDTSSKSHINHQTYKYLNHLE